MRRKTDDCWGKNTEEQVVNEKLLDLGEVPKGQTIPYDSGLKKIKESSQA